MGTPTVANIIIGGAKIWYAPVGEAIPDETTVAYDAAWGGNWARMGFTKAPLTAIYEIDEMEVDVEEELSPVDRLKIAERLRLETVLAELTAEYLELAMGQDGTGVTTTAAGVSQKGYEEISLGGNSALTKWAFGFEGRYIDTAGDPQPVRLFLHKATMKLNGNLEFSQKSGEYPGIPFQVKALSDPTQAAGQKLFKFQRVTAPATG